MNLFKLTLCYSVDENAFRLIRIRLVFVYYNQSAAAFVAVGVVARAGGLNELYAVDFHCECVHMVVAEECGDYIARSLPALKFVAVFERRAGGFVNLALEQCTVRDGVVLRAEAVFAVRVFFRLLYSWMTGIC